MPTLLLSGTRRQQPHFCATFLSIHATAPPGPPPPPSPAPATAGPGQPGQPSPAGTESTSQHHDSLDNVFTVRRPPAPAPPRSLLEMQSRRPALALLNPKKRSLIPLSWLLLPSCYPLEVTSLRGCHPGPSERSRTDLLSLRNTVDSCCFSKGL